jgi:hypothetical protein
MGMALERLPAWPAAMNRELALAYTGVSEVQLRQWEKAGKVLFRARGPMGSMLALKSQLDDALVELFAPGVADIGEDLDFG